MQVKWDETKCCHAGICVKTLPEVFKIENDEFAIDSSKASKEEIENVARLCIAGAIEVTD